MGASSVNNLSIQSHKTQNEDQRQRPDHRCGPIVVRGPMNSYVPKVPSHFIIFSEMVLYHFWKKTKYLVLAFY